MRIKFSSLLAANRPTVKHRTEKQFKVLEDIAERIDSDSWRIKVQGKTKLFEQGSFGAQNKSLMDLIRLLFRFDHDEDSAIRIVDPSISS